MEQLQSDCELLKDCGLPRALQHLHVNEKHSDDLIQVETTSNDFRTVDEVEVVGSKRGALTRCELPHGLLAANQPFSEFLHPPPPSSSHHSPSIEGPIHLQLISTPTVNTITMVAIARSFGAARVAARGFSNAGMSRACRSSLSHWV